ncbi:MULTISPECIES: exopolysaccharide biosynthesis polyprenyl glycosylphosphotransferase [unclassified Kaistella]|uniref:exopolysaccharide biosynthesis polyprenyl glycosylphosphotransferase n=1 Tax=unclassified Kaistella TaxID=2762626 RepID=UPI0027373EA4|nr:MULTISPECIES: exopolysaccharide biosynthesis polyprenyl glycosylphosphotransferase [unclassified Kaistella]MDP2452787.1 exopolysaccharide biosynthesis polyprenyl glycosylphosphotransferase [Kaistella sp. SH11-4b]MDP2455696.1 exopolysaccharide biosynthesis polyprenyl glycosylphosphotransferase [Kaistella sp. SH40-3]MDP2458600.1 exopolysaccharide biosynthesis polyprenyl glycosylphosphotransferase [Kaistella sp. SH19-2b]
MQRIRYSRYFKVSFIVLDVIVIAAVFVYFFLRNNDIFFGEELWEQNVLSITLLIFYWILLSSRTKLYSIARNITYTIYLERLVTHIFIFIFGVILLAKVSNNEFLKQDRFLIAVSLFFLLFIIKSTLFFALKYIRTKGLNYRNIMFLSDDASSQILKNILTERKDYGFKINDYPPEDRFNFDRLVKFWKEHGIHTLYLSTEFSPYEKEDEAEIHRLAEVHKVRISLIPSVIKNIFFQYDLGYIETQPILVRSKFPLNYLTNIVIKRTFDILFSVIILLLICTWLFPIIAILIKLDGKGPVFFLQKRYGYHDEVFNCIKFRTMCVNGHSSSKTTEENDKRITKIGRFLRKTSLDEMPQFINVFKGEMSVVGPRPHMLLVDDFYKLKIGRYSIRSLVKPGVTGLAQVNGLRGDAGDMHIEMQKRILADAFYVKNWTLSLDLVIILKTVFLVIGGDKNAN